MVGSMLEHLMTDLLSTSTRPIYSTAHIALDLPADIITVYTAALVV